MPNVSLLGMTIPITRMTVRWLSLLVLIGVAAVIYRHAIQEPVDIVSAKEINERLASEIQEYGVHAMEDPKRHELLEDADGALAVRVYADHCVLIQRKTIRGVRTRLVPDLARDGLRADNQIAPPSRDVLPVAHAAQRGCNGGCLNPHPN